MAKQYFVTSLAGRDVAGLASPGEGKPITLTEGQAEHPLRLGHIRLPLDHDGDGKIGGSAPAAAEPSDPPVDKPKPR